MTMTVDRAPERVLRPRRTRSLLMVLVALAMTLAVFAASPTGRAQAQVIAPVAGLIEVTDVVEAGSALVAGGPVTIVLGVAVLGILAYGGLGGDLSYLAPQGLYDMLNGLNGTGSNGCGSCTPAPHADVAVAVSVGFNSVSASMSCMLHAPETNTYYCQFPQSGGTTNWPVIYECDKNSNGAFDHYSYLPAISTASPTASNMDACPSSTLSHLTYAAAQPPTTGQSNYKMNLGYGGHGTEPGLGGVGGVPSSSLVDITSTMQCVSDTDPGTMTAAIGTIPGGGQIPTPKCPAGMHPTGTTYTGHNGVGTSVALGSATFNPGAYPSCNAGCRMVVNVDGLPCRIGVAACYDWMHLTPPQRVACMWGPYNMPTSDCAGLELGYRGGQGLSIDVTKPLNPPQLVPVGPDLKPIPQWGPGTSAPPEWGPTTAPNPGPTTAPTTAPSPTATTAPSPTPTAGGLPTAGPNPTPGGAPIPDPENPSQSCLSAAWTWNPIDWVFVPVKCALVWAFVPKDGAIGDAMAEAKGTLMGRPPVSVAVALSVPLVALVGTQVDGCTGQLADFGGGLRVPCAPPGDPGWAQALYAVMACAIVVASCLYGWHMIQGQMHKAGGE